ncbi:MULTISPECIES: MFS transporter [Spiribacter]|uniref:MFS transporter n=1 Tax=Spiribacter TaxID=1335745 RepID=UPI0022858CBB|nr:MULTISPECIES: MFS transporter [Spiribacter]
MSLSRGQVLTYGLPAVPLAVMGVPMYVFLPGFYGETLGLAAVGAALLLARLWDVVTDPLIGSLGDRLQTRWGRRRPLIAAGLPILLVSAWALFRPPEAVGLGYLLGWGLAAYLGWTLMSLPYTAWGAELSEDYDQRASLTASREGFMLAGTLLAIAWPTLVGAGRADAETLSGLAWLLVLLLPPVVALALWRVPEYRLTAHSVGWREGWQLLRHNRPFLRLLAAYVMNGLANGLPASLFTLFVIHVLRAEAWTGPLLLVYFVVGIAALPGWLWLSRRIGKHRAWALSMLWTSLIFAAVPFLGPGDTTAFLIICLLSGVGVAVDMALPAAIQADLVDIDTAAGGGRRTGLYFGIWNMATKLALALAVGIAFPLLEWFGFDATRVEDRDGTFALALFYGAVPIGFKLAATALMWRFPHDRRAQVATRARMHDTEQAYASTDSRARSQRISPPSTGN